MKTSFGLIGFGTMGSAIYDRAKDAFDILVYEKDPSKVAALPQGTVETDLGRFLSRVEAFVIAVKPQDFSALLSQCGGGREMTVISIAAGITTASLERQLPCAKAVRVMPNLPARIGKGMTCIAGGKSARQQDLRLAEQIFRKLGQVLIIDEKMMNAVTGVSGSGPGFFYEQVCGMSLHEAVNFAKHNFTEQLVAAAHEVGFSGQQALLLARQTTEGAVEMLRETRLPPETLRDQVTSKGGTTAAGLAALRQTHSLADAVKAAAKRAEELSQ
jgi:pyrroline-5-carboxylate reductase